MLEKIITLNRVWPGLHHLSLYFEVCSIYYSRTFNIYFYFEYLMLTCLRVFLEELLIQSVAFPFLILILYPKFAKYPVVFINKTNFLELKVCPKYLTKILKTLTESFFAKTLSAQTFLWLMYDKHRFWNYFLVYLVQFLVKWLRVSCLWEIRSESQVIFFVRFYFPWFSSILVLDRCYFQTRLIITKSIGMGK